MSYFTTNYSHMCFMAHEIQELRKDEEQWKDCDCFCSVKNCTWDTISEVNKQIGLGNYQLDYFTKLIKFDHRAYPTKNKFEDKFIYIWLPRFDQLNDILDFQEVYPGSFPYNHGEMVDEMIFRDYDDKHLFRNYEELWLLLVMRTNYQKIWNPEKRDWFKIGD